jgi:hypothetical protein
VRHSWTHTVGYNFVKILATPGCRIFSRRYHRQYDVLTHVPVGYVLETGLSVRFEWLRRPQVTLVTLGALLLRPEYRKRAVRLLVLGAVSHHALGNPEYPREESCLR